VSEPLGTGPEERPAGSAAWQSVRPSKVKRARELVKDPSYPSEQVIESIADLIAHKFSEEKPTKPKE
jgi:hypothetical protein